MQKTFHGQIINFDLIPDITEDDINFLSGIFERFPRVAKGYYQFISSPPETRIPLAANILETQTRTGWQLRFEELPQTFRPILVTHAGEYYGDRWLMDESSKPSSESVLEHCAEAQELFLKVYSNHSKNHRQWGAECMKFHDFHEAIDGDFTPHCPITKDEKKRLEGISTKLLCEARGEKNLMKQHIWNCLQLFEGNTKDFEVSRNTMLSMIKTQEDQGTIQPHQQQAVSFLNNLYSSSRNLDIELLRTQLSDIDALHMALRSCRMVKEKHINRENIPKMEEFWDYIDKKLQTKEAQQFFNSFKASYLDDGLTYQMATTSAVRSIEGNRSI